MVEGKKRGTWASLDNNILGVNSSSEASPRNAPASMTSRSLQRTPAVKPTFRRGSALLRNTQLWCHPKITAGFPQKVFVNPIVIIANLGDVVEETDPTRAISCRGSVPKQSGPPLHVARSPPQQSCWASYLSLHFSNLSLGDALQNAVYI